MDYSVGRGCTAGHDRAPWRTFQSLSLPIQSVPPYSTVQYSTGPSLTTLPAAHTDREHPSFHRLSSHCQSASPVSHSHSYSHTISSTPNLALVLALPCHALPCREVPVSLFSQLTSATARRREVASTGIIMEGFVGLVGFQYRPGLPPRS